MITYISSQRPVKYIKYFDKAKSASYLSDNKKVKIGAIAVYKKYTIGAGWNKQKTNPLQMFFDNKYKIQYSNNGIENHHYLHAEMDLVRQIKDLDIDFSRVKVFLYREDKNGCLANCKPCISCHKALKSIGIKEKNIYYTSEYGYIGKEV